MRILAPLRRAARSFPLSIALTIQALVLGLFLWSLASYGTVDATTETGQPDISFVLLGLPTEAIAALIIVAIVWLLGWGNACLLTTRFDWKGLKWGAPIVGTITLFAVAVAALLLFEGNQPQRTTVIWQLALFCLAVGVFEETLYRGTLYYGLSRHLSPFWAMMVSSAIFGLFHMQNIVVGQALDATAFQSVNAFALGVLFCAIMVQTNSIWPAIALHGVWNMFLFLSTYISQTQPELVGMTANDLSAQATDVTAIAFLLPTAILALGLLIFSRWVKRTRIAT